MVRVDIVYRGELRCEGTHEPSGRRLVTDAPRDNRGRGESFSPTDLVATALGSCMLTICGLLARERGWDLEGASVAVEKHMRADPVRRIAKLEVTLRLPAELPDEARAPLVEAALGCPVAMSISEGIEVQLETIRGA